MSVVGVSGCVYAFPLDLHTHVPPLTYLHIHTHTHTALMISMRMCVIITTLTLLGMRCFHLGGLPLMNTTGCVGGWVGVGVGVDGCGWVGVLHTWSYTHGYVHTIMYTHPHVHTPSLHTPSCTHTLITHTLMYTHPHYTHPHVHMVVHVHTPSCTQVVPGELTIVTGVPNSGKSEWIDALLVNMAYHHGWAFAVCSMEKKVCVFVG